jgi:hypothetical protein
MTDESRQKHRIAEPQRKQAVMVFEVPEDALPPTHPARVLWDVVDTLDLSRFLVGVKTVEGTVGRASNGQDRASMTASAIAHSRLASASRGLSSTPLEP